MTRDEFLRLAAQDCNRVPVVREVLADLETPLSTYLKLADGAYSYLLESVQGGEKWGRYSIIGLPARTVLRVDGHTATVLVDGVEQERDDKAGVWCRWKAGLRPPRLGQPLQTTVWCVPVHIRGCRPDTYAAAIMVLPLCIST